MKAFIRAGLFMILILSAPACRMLNGSGAADYNALETAAQKTIAAQVTREILSAAAATASAQAAAISTTQAEATLAPTATATLTPLPTVDAAATSAAQTAAVAATRAAGPGATQTLAMATQASLSATITALVPVQPPMMPPPVIPPPVQPPPVFPPPYRPPAGRIQFAAGATSAVVSGILPGNSTVEHLVAAGAGQTMLASVYSPNNNVYIGVTGESDGVPLQRTAAGANDFSGRLPARQDYRITLAGPAHPTEYTLEIIIPVRIQFAPGAISAAIPGRIQAGGTNHYLARARGGQIMTVSLLSPRGDIFLTIYGMTDGSPLVRSMMGETTWSGPMPITQDYMIQAVSTGPASNYTLEVIIQ